MYDFSIKTTTTTKQKTHNHLEKPFLNASRVLAQDGIPLWAKHGDRRRKQLSHATAAVFLVARVKGHVEAACWSLCPAWYTLASLTWELWAAGGWLLGASFLLPLDLVQIVDVVITTVFFLLFYILDESFDHQISPLAVLSDASFHNGK